MSRNSILAAGLIASSVAMLGACSAEPKTAAPADAAPVVAETAAAPDSSTPAVAPLSAVDLRRVCRAGLAAVHGQAPGDIDITGEAAGVVSAQWRAPVDGGVMKAQCRVNGDAIIWKPLDRPDASQARWMDQAGDPVVKFTIKGDTVAVSLTSPQGTTEQSVLTVPAQQEAR